MDPLPGRRRTHVEDEPGRGRGPVPDEAARPLAEGADADWAPRRGEPSPRWGAETEERTWNPG